VELEPNVIASLQVPNDESEELTWFVGKLLNEGRWLLYPSNHKRQAERFLGELEYYGYKVVKKDSDSPLTNEKRNV
jgi:hypothetical protein